MSKDPNATGSEPLLESLEALIERYSLLKHPFYRAWNEGSLPRESLKLYATQYYQHVRAFPENLKRLASRTSGSLQELANDNLSEELDPRGPHPLLWRRFARSVGVSDAELDTARPLPGIGALLGVFNELASEGPAPHAVAAFYAYEAQVPEIAEKKALGLRRFYGITDPEALEYFSVHQEADVRHRAAWRGWLANEKDVNAPGILSAAERTLKALWAALDAVYPEACVATN